MPQTSTLPASVSHPGEGRVYAKANTAICKITANDTGGAFELFEETCPPGFQSRLHLHTRSFQVCHVVEGTGQFILGERTVEVAAGGCVNIPPGVPHKVSSASGMKMVMLYSPPGLERMMQAMARLTPDELKDAALTRQILADHDTVVLGESVGSAGTGSVLG